MFSTIVEFQGNRIMRVILIAVFSVVQAIGVFSSLILLEVFFWIATEDKRLDTNN